MPDSDSDDFVIECSNCGEHFHAAENLEDGGEHVRCPHCGALDTDD